METAAEWVSIPLPTLRLAVLFYHKHSHLLLNEGERNYQMPVTLPASSQGETFDFQEMRTAGVRTYRLRLLLLDHGPIGQVCLGIPATVRESIQLPTPCSEPQPEIK